MLEMVICSLYFRYFVYVLKTYGRKRFVTGAASPFLYACGFLEKVRGGRGSGDEGEHAVGLHGYFGWDRYAWFDVSRTGVELLAKVHRLDTSRTKRRPHGG